VPGLGPDAPQGRPPGQGLRSGALMSTGEPRPSKISSTQVFSVRGNQGLSEALAILNRCARWPGRGKMRREPGNAHVLRASIANLVRPGGSEHGGGGSDSVRAAGKGGYEARIGCRSPHCQRCSGLSRAVGRKRGGDRWRVLTCPRAPGPSPDLLRTFCVRTGRLMITSKGLASLGDRRAIVSVRTASAADAIVAKPLCAEAFTLGGALKVTAGRPVTTAQPATPGPPRLPGRS
jgi:hypothetical protein